VTPDLPLQDAQRLGPDDSASVPVPGLNRVIRWLEQVGSIVAGACLVLMMFVVTADALGRYLLHAPLQWAGDVVSLYLMVVSIYLAVSQTFREGDHINFGMLQARMPRRLRAVTGAISALASAALFAAIAYASFGNTVQAWRGSEFMPGYVQWPVWLSHLPIAVGSALLCLRLLHHGVTLLLRGEDPSVKLEGDIEGRME
jgi:TRAP-type C4-dicarboxylate transport system permease small subunit